MSCWTHVLSRGLFFEKEQVMITVRTRDKKKFLQVHFTQLDELINLLIAGEISGKEFALLLWMCSYAWILFGCPRHDFKIPISAIAHVFEVKRGTVEKWLKNLARLELVKPKYKILVRSNVSKRAVYFDSQSEAWNYKNRYGGTQLPTTYKILAKNIHARMGKPQRKTHEQITNVQ